MRTIGVVSVGRTDWNLWLPILEEMRRDEALKPLLLVTGMHLSHEFGLTLSQIKEHDFEIADKVEMLLSSDSSQGIAKSVGVGVLGFAQVFERLRPDILLVLGDRFETLAAVAAALPFRIPVAHIHGGETTEGAIDELIRHAITKMSHIHFTATEIYAERIRLMGEEPWRVFVSGAPGIDYIKQTEPMKRLDFFDKFHLDPAKPFLLVTYHASTLEFEHTQEQVKNLLHALEATKLALLFTYPNADTSSYTIIKMLQSFVQRYPGGQLFTNLGSREYISAMRYAQAMVGNSSSGIIEAASFSLPVVNIGNRQKGRLKPNNAIDVGSDLAEIASGIRRALSPQFKETLKGTINPYGDGTASRKIVQVLREVELGKKLIIKKFPTTSQAIELAVS